MISFATQCAFTHTVPAHSFQAPTLIGCQIFKEQGTAQFVANLLTSEFKNSYLLVIYQLLLIISALFPTAEKRDYEGLFIPCQTKPRASIEFYEAFNEKNMQYIDLYIVFISAAQKIVF